MAEKKIDRKDMSEFIDQVGDVLVQRVLEYYKFRTYKFPDVNNAMLFLVSEVGELADALVSNQEAWVRNNPKEKEALEVQQEIGDIMMMLTVLTDRLNCPDPLNCMLENFARKGFEEENA